MGRFNIARTSLIAVLGGLTVMACAGVSPDAPNGQSKAPPSKTIGPAENVPMKFEAYDVMPASRMMPFVPYVLPPYASESVPAPVLRVPEAVLKLMRG